MQVWIESVDQTINLLDQTQAMKQGTWYNFGEYLKQIFILESLLESDSNGWQFIDKNEPSKSKQTDSNISSSEKEEGKKSEFYDALNCGLLLFMIILLSKFLY